MAESISAQIIDLERYRSTISASSLPIDGGHDVKASIDTEHKPSTDHRTSLDDLYGVGGDSSRLVLAARRILHDCDGRISAAIAAHGNGNLVEADLEASRAFAVWPELFLCRSISDGFGAVVLGIYYAYQNVAGDAFSLEQLTRLASSIEFLREHPFLTFDAALGLLDELEDAGLEINPAEAGALGEILAGE